MDPITLAILALLAIFGGGTAITWKGYETSCFIGRSNCNIAIFGLPQTGKTLFLNCLKKYWNAETVPTTNQCINTIKLKLNNTWFKINDTTDIGGCHNNFREYAENIIKDGDLILYFCNIHNYLTNEEIAKKDRARLLIIKDLMTKYGLNDNCVRVVLSYADQVKNREDAQELFVRSIAGERYAAFGQNIASVNMTDDSETKKFISWLFYGRNR